MNDFFIPQHGPIPMPFWMAQLLQQNQDIIPPVEEGYGKAFDSLQWLANRPSQFINQGIASGIEGENPFPAMWGSVTGGIPDIRMSQELDQPERWGDFWNERMVRLGNILDFLSPVDVAMPGGRMLARPLRGAMRYERLAPEYKAIADRLGEPIDTISNALRDVGSDLKNVANTFVDNIVKFKVNPLTAAKFGALDANTLMRFRLNPENIWGKYGIDYATTPKTLNAKLPLMLRTEDFRVGNLAKKLGYKEEMNPLGFFDQNVLRNLLNMGRNPQGNLIVTGSNPQTPRHEFGHYLKSLLESGSRQPSSQKKLAESEFWRLMPGSYKSRQRGNPSMTGAMEKALENKIKKDAEYWTPRSVVALNKVYKPEAISEELLVRSLANQVAPSWDILKDPRFSALSKMLYGESFIPQTIFEPTPFPFVPTPALGITRRAMTRED